MDFRYANIALRSSSGNCPYQFHGIGGRMGRLLPMCLPCLSAATNMSSVQMPRPVFMSGVRLAANETPQAPLHAVRWSLVCVVHGRPGCGLNGFGTPALSG